MTGGQTALLLSSSQGSGSEHTDSVGFRRVNVDRDALKVIKANDNEEATHIERMRDIEKISGKDSWKTLFQTYL
jgi:hypothetical protein